MRALKLNLYSTQSVMGCVAVPEAMAALATASVTY